MEVLTILEVGQFASRLDSLLLNIHYRTNRRVTQKPALELLGPGFPSNLPMLDPII
jgi:hypothetical protein